VKHFYTTKTHSGRHACWVPLQTAFELNRPEVVVGCAHDWAPPSLDVFTFRG
jgi:hypothetical protein